MATAGGYCALIHGGEHQVDLVPEPMKTASRRVENAVKESGQRINRGMFSHSQRLRRGLKML